MGYADVALAATCVEATGRTICMVTLTLVLVTCWLLGAATWVEPQPKAAISDTEITMPEYWRTATSGGLGTRRRRGLVEDPRTGAPKKEAAVSCGAGRDQ